MAIGSGTAIFDLDGTLVDSMSVQAEVFADVLGDAEASVGSDRAIEVYYSTAGAPLVDQFRTVDPALSDTDLQQLEAAFYRSVGQRSFAAFDDSRRCLVELRDAGWRIAVSSGSSQASVDAKLAGAGLADLVELALGSEPASDFTKGAAHNAAIQAEFAAGAARPAFSAFIGDTAHDATVAGDAGFLAILVRRPGPPLFGAAVATVVESLDAVPPILAAASRDCRLR